MKDNAKKLVDNVKNPRMEPKQAPRRPPFYTFKQKKEIKEKMFQNKQQSPTEVTGELVKADCMNHGYRIISDIGEGAYAKVKLAEVLPSKLARNQIMADAAEQSGELKVLNLKLSLIFVY